MFFKTINRPGVARGNSSDKETFETRKTAVSSFDYYETDNECCSEGILKVLVQGFIFLFPSNNFLTWVLDRG